MIGVALVLFGVALCNWSRGAPARAIGDLPGAQRRAIYQRAIEDLEATCRRGHAQTLDAHCTAQAEFVLLFPECDAGCQDLARRRSAPKATR